MKLVCLPLKHWRVLLQFFFKNPDLTLLSAEVRVHAAACVSTDFIYDGSCLSCVHKKGSKL